MSCYGNQALRLGCLRALVCDCRNDPSGSQLFGTSKLQVDGRLKLQRLWPSWLKANGISEDHLAGGVTARSTSRAALTILAELRINKKVRRHSQMLADINGRADLPVWLQAAWNATWKDLVKYQAYIHICQSQWPSGLRRGSADDRLLGLRVRIPPGTWTSVCCECCVCCQVEVSATGWSLVQRSPTDCGVPCVWSCSLRNEEAQTR